MLQSNNILVPSTDKNVDEHSNEWGILRCRDEAAPTREDTPAPDPAPAAQPVQRGRRTRVYPPGYALECPLEPKGKHSYPTTTELRVIEYTRRQFHGVESLETVKRWPGWNWRCDIGADNV